MLEISAILTVPIATSVEPWFPNTWLPGTILGCSVGLLGGIYGSVMGICAPRGVARRLVYGMHFGLLALGAALLIAGVVAVSGGQPYGVWYPLLLEGVILSTVMGPLTPVMRLRYRQAEHRRLEAEEFRRG